MKKSYQLEQCDVKLMINAAEQEAIKNQWTVSIAVCDSGGFLLALSRLDNAAAISAKVAKQKAHCSAISGKPSAAYEKMINDGRFAALSMPITTLQGALPIIIDNNIIGAVGVSGVKPEQDEQIAQAAINALLESIHK